VIECLQKRWTINLFDVVLIPETGTTDALAIGEVPEPLSGGRIDWSLAEVAQQRDRVALNVRALAVRSRRVADREPTSFR
jgi:hypothetical protein